MFIKEILLLSLLIPSISYSQACSLVNTENVVKLPQVHWDAKAENNPEALEALAVSQFEISQTLQGFPERAVFFETEMKSQADLRSLAKRTFPSGRVPPVYQRLNINQKKFLARYSAVDILFLLGKIKVIRKDSSSTEIERWQKSNPDQKAFVVGGHNPDLVQATCPKTEIAQHLKIPSQAGNRMPASIDKN